VFATRGSQNSRWTLLSLNNKARRASFSARADLGSQHLQYLVDYNRSRPGLIDGWRHHRANNTNNPTLGAAHRSVPRLTSQIVASNKVNDCTTHEMSRLGNSLPDDVISLETLPNFRKRIKNSDIFEWLKTNWWTSWMFRSRRVRVQNEPNRNGGAKNFSRNRNFILQPSPMWTQVLAFLKIAHYPGFVFNERYSNAYESVTVGLRTIVNCEMETQSIAMWEASYVISSEMFCTCLRTYVQFQTSAKQSYLHTSNCLHNNCSLSYPFHHIVLVIRERGNKIREKQWLLTSWTVETHFVAMRKFVRTNGQDSQETRYCVTYTM
jgi:hypothetical protein